MKGIYGKTKVNTVDNSPENGYINPVNHEVYLCGQSVKLTSCNLLCICRDIEKTVGPVQKTERRGLSLKLACTSVKQKEEVLACSLVGNIDAVASLLSYLLCRILAGFARFRQASPLLYTGL